MSSTTTNNSTQSQAYLTPRGVHNPLKEALLERFPLVRSTFDQHAFIESLNLPQQVLADIWLPVGFPPVCFEALNEEEEKVASNGQFGTNNSRTGINNRNNSYSHNNNNNNNNNSEYRRGPNPNYSGNNQQGPRNPNQRPRGVSSSGPNSFTNHRLNPRQDQEYSQSHSAYSRPQTSHSHSHQSYENADNDVIEDPDNLWSTPTNDTLGSSDFGTFDENGIFKSGGIGDLGASATFDGFNQGRPNYINSEINLNYGNQSTNSFINQNQNYNQNQNHTLTPPMTQSIPVPVSSAPTPAIPAIPLITPDTQWLYRDPSGLIQGPFPSHRMIEWYNGKYFPENLPLRRVQDPFFEPLSSWKTKCAGQVPFTAYTKPVEVPVVETSPISPRVTFTSPSQAQPRPTATSEWFKGTETFNRVEQTSVAQPIQFSAQLNSSQAQTQSQTRSLPLESLFNLPKPSAPVQEVEKTVSPPEVLMPAAVGGWKKLEKPSIAAKFGQLEISSSSELRKEVEPIAIVKASVYEKIKSVENKSVENKPNEINKSTEINKTVEMSKSVENKPIVVSSLESSETINNTTTNKPLTSQPSWSTSSMSNSGLKKISLSEIMKSSEEPFIELSNSSSSIGFSANASALAAAGWAKLSASPVQSLSSIQAEEAARQRKVSTSAVSVASTSSSAVSASSASKSFADLVRSAGVITNGNIIVSPPLAEKVSLKARSDKPIESHAITSASSAAKSFVAPSIATKPISVATTVESKALSIEDWCLVSLKQSSGLSKSIDPQTCTILLLDLPNPSALLNFSLETLKPLQSTASTDNFDLATFVKELSTKKFGAKATEKVQWTKLKSNPTVKKPEEESFEVVKRKK